ncbi:MAG: GNAT family N-acetyltransferase [Acidobacteria bacterium]|nr:MAG: GNAT family N-acetyltransferase [Acidobacteriota bacterium]
MEDLEKVAQLENRVWRELAATPDDLRRRFLVFPQGFLLAAAGSDLLGFSCSLLTDTDARVAALNETFPPRHIPRGEYFFLFGLTVDPLFRRNGIARRLVTEELALAEKLGCRKVQLIANASSRPLFEKSGLAVVRPSQELFVQYRDLMPQPVLMEKVLTRGDGGY